VSSLDQVEWFKSAEQMSGVFYNTYYYLKEESLEEAADEEKTEEVRTPSDKVIANVTPRFKELMDIEGSGKLDNGLVINYAGKINGEIRYLPTIHEWGRGVGNCALKPFRVAAVDRNVIPLGSVIFIQESVGMKLPDGSIHDGYWLAGDVGGAIKDRHLDLFIGSERWSRTLSKHKMSAHKNLHVSIVGKASSKSCRYQKSQ
jgi:3D (Asp-Asp-Asp) domain-containing protein